MNNITHQIRQGTHVPKRIEDYSEEEKEGFPKLYEWLVSSTKARLSVCLVTDIWYRHLCFRSENAAILEGKSYTRLKPYYTNESDNDK